MTILMYGDVASAVPTTAVHDWFCFPLVAVVAVVAVVASVTSGKNRSIESK